VTTPSQRDLSTAFTREMATYLGGRYISAPGRSPSAPPRWRKTRRRISNKTRPPPPHRLLHSCPRPPCETDIGRVTRFSPLFLDSAFGWAPIPESGTRCLIILRWVLYFLLSSNLLRDYLTDNLTEPRTTRTTDGSSFPENNRPAYFNDWIFDILAGLVV
jgi:hypothetical protein